VLTPRSAAKELKPQRLALQVQAEGIREGGNTDAFGKTKLASVGKRRKSQKGGGATNISPIKSLGHYDFAWKPL